MDKMTTGVSNKSLFAEERQRKIIETINANGKAVVPVLCEMFGVSSSTIRNDLKQLEGKKLITRTHGGAIRNSKMGRELSPTDKETQMMPQKKAIARAAPVSYTHLQYSISILTLLIKGIMMKIK